MQTADSLALNPCLVESQPQWGQSLCNVCISSGRLIMVSVLGDNAVCGYLMGKRKQKDMNCGLMSSLDWTCSPVPPGFKINPDTVGMDELGAEMAQTLQIVALSQDDETEIPLRQVVVL